MAQLGLGGRHMMMDARKTVVLSGVMIGNSDKVIALIHPEDGLE